MGDEGVKIHAGAVVSGEANIEGDVTIHPRTAVHPTAVIVASPGHPIVIGSGNIIEERSTITSEHAAVTIGDGNHVQVGAKLESSQLGNANVLEPNCEVGSGCTVPNACVVGALVRESHSSSLPL
jgi:carbonic anhydrase/acetyltransferase-like protein (isoleucine patch superfamily)